MDKRHFSSLFELYKKPYVLFAHSYIRDMDEAEDIYMDVMANLWENRDSLPEDLDVRSYLLAAVKNRALNCLRHRQVISDTHSHMLEHDRRELDFRISTLEACEPSELFAAEIKHIISGTLRRMPEQTRLIFFMSRYENRTNREISQQLGINIKTVEYHVGKALKVLRLNLKDYLPFFILGLIRELEIFIRNN